MKIAAKIIEAEQALLGGAMLLGTHTTVQELVETVKPTMLALPATRVAWAALGAVVERGDPLDLLTLSAELEDRGELEAAGGFIALGEILRNTPSAANVGTYAEIVRDGYLERGALQALERAKSALLAPGKAQDKIEAAQRALAGIDTGTRGDPRTIGNVLEQYLDKLQARLDNPESVQGIGLGVDGLEDATPYLNQDDLVVVAARPAMGKTTLAGGILKHCTLDLGKAGLFCSLEMGADQIAERMLSLVGKLDAGLLRRPGDMDDQHWTAFNGAFATLSQSRLLVDDTPGLGLDDVRAMARRAKARHPDLGVIMVDYLGLMETPAADRHDLGIGKITMGLKNLAKELKTPVVLLCQLSRAVEQRSNKRPMNSDLRDSGSIEQDADLILFLYREQAYDRDTPLGPLTEIYHGKNRHGPLGLAYADLTAHGFVPVAVEDVDRRQQKQGSKKQSQGFE